MRTLIPDHLASRQLRWQRRKRAEGKCEVCGKPGARVERDGKEVTMEFCSHHGDMNRTLARNRKRLAAGIPLDAPLSGHGRKRIY